MKQLMGGIPNRLGELSNLQGVLWQNNLLTGAIPQSLANLF